MGEGGPGYSMCVYSGCAYYEGNTEEPCVRGVWTFPHRTLYKSPVIPGIGMEQAVYEGESLYNVTGLLQGHTTSIIIIGTGHLAVPHQCPMGSNYIFVCRIYMVPKVWAALYNIKGNSAIIIQFNTPECFCT